MTGTEPDLRRVVYISHALPGGADEALLADILRSSRRNNPQVGVTGALVYSARRFAQVLEGPAAEVEAVFERIQCDPRHDNITVLEVSSPAARAFAGWSMAFTRDARAAPADTAAPDTAERLVGLLQQVIRNTEAATA
jgi:hypothetical protein